LLTDDQTSGRIVPTLERTLAQSTTSGRSFIAEVETTTRSLPPFILTPSPSQAVDPDCTRVDEEG
jgi:hypothetical protein